MSIETVPTAEDDMQAVADAFLASRPIPPEVAKRVEERAQDFRRRMIAEHGLQDIGVSLIRQNRENSN